MAAPLWLLAGVGGFLLGMIFSLVLLIYRD